MQLGEFVRDLVQNYEYCIIVFGNFVVSVQSENSLLIWLNIFFLIAVLTTINKYKRSIPFIKFLEIVSDNFFSPVNVRLKRSSPLHTTRYFVQRSPYTV